MFSPKIITIGGPAGSGKTTIGKMLAEKLDFFFIKEDFEDNVYLPKYRNGEGFLEETEKWFIKRDSERYVRAFELVNNGKGVVVDKPFFQNFETIMSIDGFKSETERNKCVWMLMPKITTLPKPDIILDIHIGRELLHKGIAMRGREMERTMRPEDELLKRQRLLHEALINRFYGDVSRIIIDRDHTDFIDNGAAIENLYNDICRL